MLWLEGQVDIQGPILRGSDTRIGRGWPVDRDLAVSLSFPFPTLLLSRYQGFCTGSIYN